MRPTFGREYVEAELRQIGDRLSDQLTVYLVGGGAMALRDLKEATKDVDLVVADGDAHGQLWTALMDLGYTEVQSPGPEYRELGATSCVENDDGCRLDIFNRQVANKLVLTDGMRTRSETFLDDESLTVRIVGNEDIFLFKMIAGRDDDVVDMNVLVQAGLDFEVVSAELDAQIDRLDDDQFVTFANEALIDLEDEYGVTTPLGERIRALTRRYYRGLAVLQVLDERSTLDEIATELGVDADDVDERVSYLAEFGQVSRSGDEIVRRTE